MTDRPRPAIDFGITADDYARHRPGFPPGAFARFARHGIGLAGQRVLDLGTGTGTLARGLVARGAWAVGLDPSPSMLAAAAAMPGPPGPRPTLVRARAEMLPFGPARFDVVCAGQCWHWFDRVRAANELARVLRPGGRALIAYFSYLAEPGTLGAVTERLVLRHQPGWEWAHQDGRYPSFTADLVGAGLEAASELEFTLPIAFTHEGWRGRFRACNGVLTLPPDRVAAFDAELAAMLAAEWPEPLMVEHRVWATIARRGEHA
ncbi:MAG: class I SAM-dependent methyltransferase [Candidatus Eisenbacteria bacterium]